MATLNTWISQKKKRRFMCLVLLGWRGTASKWREDTDYWLTAMLLLTCYYYTSCWPINVRARGWPFCTGLKLTTCLVPQTDLVWKKKGNHFSPLALIFLRAYKSDLIICDIITMQSLWAERVLLGQQKKNSTGNVWWGFLDWSMSVYESVIKGKE